MTARRASFCAVALVLVAAVAPSPARASGGRSPAAVVRAYIGALDRRDGGAVCRLFAPQLRAYEDRWQAPNPRWSCARIVKTLFSSYYSRHRWASATVRGRLTTRIEPRTGIAAVHMTLVHTYVCAAQSRPPERCRASRYVRAEIIYLLRSGGRWEIIKPGRVFQIIDTPSPLSAESDYYPPATSQTVTGPVTVNAPATSCPASATTYTAPPHDLQTVFAPNPGGSAGNEPWLKIDGVSVARLSSRTICFTLTLDGPPHPDSSYELSLGTIAQQAAADRFDVEFDGLGVPHPLEAGEGPLSMPSLSGHLPHVFVSGNHLEMVVTDPWFASVKRFVVVAGTQSLQYTEPLIRRPIDAADSVPLGSCLVFPSGALDRQGLCGATPGP